MLASQLSSKDAPQVDERTNTIFFRETRSNIDNIRKLLVQIDKPTKQVMIEARLVEVNANPEAELRHQLGWRGWQLDKSADRSITAAIAAGTSKPRRPAIGIQSRRLHPRECQGNNNFFGSLSQLAGEPVCHSYAFRRCRSPCAL